MLDLFKGRGLEFFEESKLLSMARLTTFIATVVVAIATIWSLAVGAWDSSINFAGMLCGLGGFNYAFNRGAGAYQAVRISQAEQGIQPQPMVAAIPSPITINTASNAAPVQDMNVQGDINVKGKSDATSQPID